MTNLSRISRSIITAGILTTVVLLFSFNNRNAGGEGFEVYLNDKLVLQQFGHKSPSSNMLDLEQAKPADKISVKYYHCGKVPKNGLLSVRNDKSDILKKWNFIVRKQTTADVNCKAAEILNLETKQTTMQLYYSSTDLPGGRLIAGIRTPASKRGF
jgi:hypothetical protein